MTHAEVMRRYRKRLRERAIAAVGGWRCGVKGCEELEKLEFAHLRSTGLNGASRGQDRRFRDVINNPECYLLLCKEHHKLYDSGELEIDPCA